MDTFIPFILEIVDQYYKNTPNEDNKSQLGSLKDQLASLSLEESKGSQNPPLSIPGLTPTPVVP